MKYLVTEGIQLRQHHLKNILRARCHDRKRSAFRADGPAGNGRVQKPAARRLHTLRESAYKGRGGQVDARMTTAPPGNPLSAPALKSASAACAECCRWRRKRVPKWRRGGPLPREPFGVSLSLFSEVLSGTARSRQGRAVVGRGEANP